MIPTQRRSIRVSRLVAAVTIGAVVAACGSSTPATPTSTPQATSATASPTASPAGAPAASGSGAGPSNAPGLPDFSHVYVIILENKEYDYIVGSAAAPYENSLVARYGVATNFYAETHPSEPNYIALTSGGLQGTNSDGTYDLEVPNLFDQVEASGRTWHLYAQSYPGTCYLGSSGPSVADGPGLPGDYARKHVPAISYTSISRNPDRCSRITTLSGFDPAAASFEMIIPNEINDMHSSSVAVGDAFLKAFVPEIVDSPAFANSVLFITFDEGDTDVNGGGHIATLVASPGMPPGSRYDAPATHYSMLRTIEEAWGLPLLGQAADAVPLNFDYGPLG